MTDHFNYDELSKLPVEEIIINFYGSGDEGYVEGVSTVPDLPEGVEISADLGQKFEQIVYDLLGSHHPGWEINEGAQGCVTVYVNERRAVLHYGENEIKTTYYDTEVS